jgi:sugar phosphate isomerase/epimerase
MIAGHPIALAALTVLDASPPDVVDLAAAAGYDAITLRTVDANVDEPNPLADDTPLRRETLARLKHHGLDVLDIEVVRLAGDTDVGALRPMLECAALLGAQHALIIGLEPDEDRLVERYREVCEEAAAVGIRAVLEFMVFSEVRTVQHADRVVAGADHPSAGVLVDTLHLARSGGTPEELAALVRANPDRYPYCQLCDGPREAPEGGKRGLYKEAVAHRLYPGDGELPLREDVAALPAGAPLSLETPVLAYADRSPAERARLAIEATRRLLEG